MVEVFKTNIKKASEARSVTRLLIERFPECRVDFDLEDCDKILRVEAHKKIPGKVKELLQTNGYYCEELH